jgi:hypothetical protein
MTKGTVGNYKKVYVVFFYNMVPKTATTAAILVAAITSTPLPDAPLVAAAVAPADVEPGVGHTVSVLKTVTFHSIRSICAASHFSER